jgi:hypothetical protein
MAIKQCIFILKKALKTAKLLKKTDRNIGNNSK